jgi:hypothetical protein
MFRQLFAASESTLLPLIGMFLLLTAFVAILYWVLVVLRNSPLPEYMANLPLSDGPLSERSQEESSND